MPIDKYFKGHGAEVMAEMMKKNGAKAGKSEFYATANKMHMKPGQMMMPTSTKKALKAALAKRPKG